MFSEREIANFTVLEVILPSPLLGQTYTPVIKQQFVSWHIQHILGVTIRIFKKGKKSFKSSHISVFTCSTVV